MVRNLYPDPPDSEWVIEVICCHCQISLTVPRKQEWYRCYDCGRSFFVDTRAKTKAEVKGIMNEKYGQIPSAKIHYEPVLMARIPEGGTG